jgi:hypothetical protein
LDLDLEIKLIHGFVIPFLVLGNSAYTEGSKQRRSRREAKSDWSKKHSWGFCFGKSFSNNNDPI